MKRKNSIIILVAQIIAVLLLGCGAVDEPTLMDLSQEDNDTDVVTEDMSSYENDEDDSDSEKLIYVHISGAVVNPGLYEVPEGSRLYDAVMEAGGFADDAALDYSNLAEVLLDGVKYHIYSDAEVEDGQLATDVGGLELSSHYNTAGQLNINLATAQELMELSGIGESKADAIIEYRDKNGAFSSIEEIKNVPGIGEGLFSRIEDSITVN